MDKRRILLLNSTVMPQEGVYKALKISEKDFINILKNNDFISYIGHENTVKHLNKITNLNIPFNRENAVLKDNDIILVARLKKRISSENIKTIEATKEDYEYYIIKYNTLTKNINFYDFLLDN